MGSLWSCHGMFSKLQEGNSWGRPHRMCAGWGEGGAGVGVLQALCFLSRPGVGSLKVRSSCDREGRPGSCRALTKTVRLGVCSREGFAECGSVLGSGAGPEGGPGWRIAPGRASRASGGASKAQQCWGGPAQPPPLSGRCGWGRGCPPL